MPQCDETRFSTIQPSVYMTGIRNETWQWKKDEAIILVALVPCSKSGVNRPKQTKVIERKLNLIKAKDIEICWNNEQLLAKIDTVADDKERITYTNHSSLWISL